MFFFFYISKFSLHLRFTLLMKKDFIYIYIIYQKNVHLIKRTISIFREKSILKMLVPWYHALLLDFILSCASFRLFTHMYKSTRDVSFLKSNGKKNRVINIYYWVNNKGKYRLWFWYKFSSWYYTQTGCFIVFVTYKNKDKFVKEPYLGEQQPTN